jgi:hypothetical protein
MSVRWINSLGNLIFYVFLQAIPNVGVYFYGQNGKYKAKYRPFLNPILYDTYYLFWSDPFPLREKRQGEGRQSQ